MSDLDAAYSALTPQQQAQLDALTDYFCARILDAHNELEGQE